jgi:predicted amidohydrolase
MTECPSWLKLRREWFGRVMAATAYRGARHTAASSINTTEQWAVWGAFMVSVWTCRGRELCLNMGVNNDVAPLKIAVWQAASTRSNLEANLQALDKAAYQARAEGVDLLITPEMYITGYSIGEDIARLASNQPLMRVSAIAKQNGLAIIAGGPEQLEDGRIANSAWFVDDQGITLAKHRKIQLFGNLDRENFVAGEQPVTLATYRGVRIALLICFDVEYPEAARAAALAGADLIAVPTAQMDPFSFVNEHMIRVRAWENSVYVAYANQFGPDGDFQYVGLSVIADPFGRHLAQAPASGEALISTTVELSQKAAARQQNPYLAEVRRELFMQSS